MAVVKREFFSIALNTIITRIRHLYTSYVNLYLLFIFIIYFYYLFFSQLAQDIISTSM